MARFTPGELEVMRVLWTHGELKPAEIQSHFGRPIKNSALRSYLTILVEKGHVARRRRGKAYLYRSRTKEETAFRAMLGSMVESFFSGSTEALICRLIEAEDLSDDQLIELRRIAARASRGRKNKGGKS